MGSDSSNIGDIMNELKMNDDAIAMIAKLLQIAILTGTDVVDNLRTMKFSVVDGEVVPSEDFVAVFNTQLAEMQAPLDEEQ